MLNHGSMVATEEERRKGRGRLDGDQSGIERIWIGVSNMDTVGTMMDRTGCRSAPNG